MEDTYYERLELLNKYAEAKEKNIREYVAREIEMKHNKCWSFSDCSHKEDAAIARGQHK